MAMTSNTNPALEALDQRLRGGDPQALAIEQKAASIRYIRALRRLKEILAQVPELTTRA